MATVNNNLSEYDKDTMPSGEGMRIGIVVAEWNHHITGNLLKGAHQTLLDNGVAESDVLVEWVPGSFELPLGAKMMLGLNNVDAVLCLGSVIRGETSHFDYVCQATALGVKDVSLEYGKPVIFGVLTDDNEQQSLDRSGGQHGNKGDEAAVAAIKMVALKKRLKAHGTKSSDKAGGFGFRK